MGVDMDAYVNVNTSNAMSGLTINRAGDGYSVTIIIPIVPCLSSVINWINMYRDWSILNQDMIHCMEPVIAYLREGIRDDINFAMATMNALNIRKRINHCRDMLRNEMWTCRFQINYVIDTIWASILHDIPYQEILMPQLREFVALKDFIEWAHRDENIGIDVNAIIPDPITLRASIYEENPHVNPDIEIFNFNIQFCNFHDPLDNILMYVQQQIDNVQNNGHDEYDDEYDDADEYMMHAREVHPMREH